MEGEKEIQPVAPVGPEGDVYLEGQQYHRGDGVPYTLTRAWQQDGVWWGTLVNKDGDRTLTTPVERLQPVWKRFDATSSPDQDKK